MSYLRIQIDVAIKEPIPDKLKNELPGIKDAIRRLKSYASIINEGYDNEEMTVKATSHKCRHDENLPCDEVGDI